MEFSTDTGRLAEHNCRVSMNYVAYAPRSSANFKACQNRRVKRVRLEGGASAAIVSPDAISRDRAGSAAAQFRKLAAAISNFEPS